MSKFGGEKPIFFDKTGFSPPNLLSSQKNDQRTRRPLDSGRKDWFWGFGIFAPVTGFDVRHDLQRAVFSCRDLGLIIETTF